MHALCSPSSVMQDRKKLQTMMNGYLPPALERKVHLLKKKKKKTGDVAHWFCLTGFWGFGVPGSGIEFLLTQPRKKKHNAACLRLSHFHKLSPKQQAEDTYCFREKYAY